MFKIDPPLSENNPDLVLSENSLSNAKVDKEEVEPSEIVNTPDVKLDGLNEVWRGNEKQKKNIEEKRRRGRIRSKKSRDRKRTYISQLEARVKELEAENFRLQNLLLKYREDKYKNIDNSSQSYADRMMETKKGILEKYINLETLEMKNTTPLSFPEAFNQNTTIIRENHQSFLGSLIEALINNVYPVPRFYYWKHLKGAYSRTFEEFKKYSKTRKYEKQELIDTKGFTEVDDFIMSFKPNKKQFTFLKDVVLKKEYDIKNKIAQGIEYLLKAKSTFDQTNNELFALICLLFKSKIFRDEQLLTSKTLTGFMHVNDGMRDIWNIQPRQREVVIDMANDPILGKSSLKYLKKRDRIVKWVYTAFDLPEL